MYVPDPYGCNNQFKFWQVFILCSWSWLQEVPKIWHLNWKTVYCNTPQVHGWFWYLAVPKSKVFFPAPETKKLWPVREFGPIVSTYLSWKLEAWFQVISGGTFCNQKLLLQQQQQQTTNDFQILYSFTSNFPKHMKFSCKWTESKSVTEVRFAVLAIANGWDGWLSKWSIIKCESLKVSFVWFFISLNWCFLGGRRIEPQDICLQWCMGEPSCKKSLSSLEYQNCNIVLARFFLHHRTCWWRWSCIHWCFFPCNCCFSQDCG